MSIETWVPGILALVGAALGVFLSDVLQRRSRQQETQLARIDRALESVVVAISAHHFVTRLAHTGAPKGVGAAQIAELEAKLFMSNLERVMMSLRDARRDVALLVAHGLDLGDSWRSDEAI